jgi:glycosyltransferase involved in cell wall biosynthesis
MNAGFKAAMRRTLAVSMIVRNESAHICTALENLGEFADEVVVLDTGSTDETKRLAAERGALVHDFVWCDDFAKARNVSLAHCTKDFVMWLDADDRMPREDAIRLRELLQTEPDWDVLYLPYQCSTSARKMPPRIFRNGIGIQWI